MSANTIGATLPQGWANKYSLLNDLEADRIFLIIMGERVFPSSLPFGQRVFLEDQFGKSIIVVKNVRGKGNWHVETPRTKRSI